MNITDILYAKALGGSGGGGGDIKIAQVRLDPQGTVLNPPQYAGTFPIYYTDAPAPEEMRNKLLNMEHYFTYNTDSTIPVLIIGGATVITSVLGIDEVSGDATYANGVLTITGDCNVKFDFTK